jgi:hypothetical protein
MAAARGELLVPIFALVGQGGYHATFQMALIDQAFSSGLYVHNVC